MPLFKIYSLQAPHPKSFIIFLQMIFFALTKFFDLKSIKEKKAHGADGISFCNLSAASSAAARGLNILYNLCLQRNHYPAIWKISIVKPIFKKGLPSDVSNL